MDISLDAPRSVRVVAGEKVAVGLSVLCRHQHVDDGVGAGAQIDQDVAHQKPKVMRRIPDNLENI